MFKLPKKGAAITKGTVSVNDDGTYKIVFKSPLKEEAEFKEIIEVDVPECLGDGDSIVDSSWESKSVTLKLANLRDFQKLFSRRFYFLQRA